MAGAISSNQVVAEVVAGVIMAEVTAKTFSPEKTKHAPQPVPKGVLGASFARQPTCATTGLRAACAHLAARLGRCAM